MKAVSAARISTHRGRQQANSNFASMEPNPQKLMFFGDFSIDSQNDGA
jgi:hypothetical protein